MMPPRLDAGGGDFTMGQRHLLADNALARRLDQPVPAVLLGSLPCAERPVRAPCATGGAGQPAKVSGTFTARAAS